MEKQHLRDKLADLLDAVASARLQSGDAMKAWKLIDGDDDPIFGAAWHALHHFDVDEDIRLRDPSYDSYTRAKLREHAEVIRRIQDE